jgi:hypothetical protein
MLRPALFAAAAAAVTVAGGCARTDGEAARSEPAPTPAPDRPTPRPRTGPAPEVVIETRRGEARVEVEVVRTQQAIRRGLMYRTHLGENAGMLFLFRREKIQSFWMKNTLIPLDMIFIRADMTVAGVVENAEPRTLTGRSVPTPSQYVLEVNGGWSAKRGVGAGDRVRFENVGAVPEGVPMGGAPGTPSAKPAAP